MRNGPERCGGVYVVDSGGQGFPTREGGGEGGGPPLLDTPSLCWLRVRDVCCSNGAPWFVLCCFESSVACRAAVDALLQCGQLRRLVAGGGLFLSTVSLSVESLSLWQVSSGTSFRYMFYGASSFSSDLR